MQKCQYILEQDLPPLGQESQIKHVKNACDMNKAPLGPSALSYTLLWKIHESQLRGAIVRHIEAGKRIFRKFAPGSRRLLEKNLQANVSLPDGPDVYVEMVLMNNQMIILNAHNHTPGPRLPQ
jgi:hypothetical protein